MSIVKREPLPAWGKMVVPIAAVLTTMAISVIPILIAGGDVWKSFYYLFYGALGTKYNLLETFVKASPLMLTGLAVAFAFRAKFWNIGAEGQLLAGALVATVVGINWGGLPGFLALPAVMIFGFLAGGIWAAIPAFLKTKLNVDDVVTTLLLNYVMLYIMGALLFGPLQQPGSSWPRSPEIVEFAKYPILVARSRFHFGIPLALVMVFVIWFINKKTVFGFRSRAVGINPRASFFGGIKTNSVILWTALISGGLAGLAGVGELCAIQYRLISDISPGYGYTGIVIAMLGNLHPVGVLFASIFFSVIIVGAQTMSRMTGVPSYIAEVIQGIALIVMLIFLLFTEYKLRVVKK